MKLSAKDLKALGWFIQAKKLRPKLSNPPKMYFTNEAGEEVTHDLTGIVLEYKSYSEEDSKERARQKKAKDALQSVRRIV